MKILGYLIAIIGLIGITASIVPQLKNLLIKSIKLTFLTTLNTLYLTVGSIVIVLIGIFLVMKSGGRKSIKGMEVPIYQGKDIVGYRRH